MSEESIENLTKLDSLFAATFVNHYLLSDENFNGHYLMNSNISIPKNVINLYISYKLNLRFRIKHILHQIIAYLEL